VHSSLSVQASLSSHDVPSATVAPVHAPPLHESVLVHVLASLHDVPSATGAPVQAPSAH